ncbi:hypothetical protein JAAARDRAFT_582230 [Jaapia argillacea MUCL 33604]|uniref:Uncharacterized protein n=1 Tax=Jaapia argillacea MUCL 33604 TaxID=933084 RepID=A0A067P9M8_9AGAM|nr:hypothetical protein JAAARDRAFT_582230 [Jaapia argillacea MUCL 33604]
MSSSEIKRHVLRSIHLDEIWRDSGSMAPHLIFRKRPCKINLVEICLVPGGKWLIELVEGELSLIDLATHKCVGSVLVPVEDSLYDSRLFPGTTLLSGDEVGIVVRFHQGTRRKDILHIYRVDTRSSDPGFHLITEVSSPIHTLSDVALVGNILACLYQEWPWKSWTRLVVRDIYSQTQATVFLEGYPLTTLFAVQILSERWVVVVDDDGVNVIDISNLNWIPCTGDFLKDIQPVQHAPISQIHEHNNGWRDFRFAISSPRSLRLPLFLGSSRLFIIDVDAKSHAQTSPTLSTITKVLGPVDMGTKSGTRRSVTHYQGRSDLLFSAGPKGDNFDQWKEEDFVISLLDLDYPGFPIGDEIHSFAYDEFSGRMCIVLASSRARTLELYVVDVQ